MNLIIDVGNTHTKIAIFEENKLAEKVRIETSNSKAEIENFKKKYRNLKKAIVSSVGKLDQDTLSFLEAEFKLQILSHKTKLPFKNLYRTPKTLGIDRIALVCASIKQFPDKNVLIIDAGTCITYDFISAKNEYLGGAISPGIRMRYKAMHNLTANLPLLETEIPRNFIGDSTTSAMHCGVVNGVLNEIDGSIAQYQEKFSDLTVILTGGDTKMLSKQLKSSIFANSNFLLQGLNFILQYNTH
ncbi:type III pantothenate kinase [Lacinutrix sp. 5H-3-7-4]|uniref:type III pantothenate kinase n=1 Tax=Lacinutrix sp. (strain 5H-3-7-4) TaxID=983544 RepID=UPI00020A395E|nr:type III pantothenate kinase [Lacinutrix sp. 5H-3-7-4]AEH00431.1 putative transcriptional acitvator, Baf family [Lacinutrix sp. 5H-3-7-4]